ncbi:CHAD domain-containing protein [Streptomyces sp. NPDC018031]|uniref:CYTH and CHAD domain-containing protein n=1 Tax=Streptomyces sp. NPDC018031 TaxID=3365033 RepID=UPI00379DBA38
MARTVREVERKYEAVAGSGSPAPAALRAVTGTPGVAALEERGDVVLDAVYHDTADRRLAAHGVTLRRRTGGDDQGWHLKLPVRAPGGGGSLIRDEIRAPLADTVPGELLALVRSRTRDAELRPLIRLTTVRTVCHLLGTDGRRLAELAVDRVAAERMAGDPGPGFHWTEVEVELARGGDAGLLDRIESRLVAAGLRPAATGSKLARALAETDPDPAAQTAAAPGAAARAEPGSAGEVVLDYVRRQIAAIVALDPAVRLDTPDAVHRMRVATRRLRATFRSYRAVLDPAGTGPVADELKWLAAELGVDRDREVRAARLVAALERVPDTLRLGPVRARLRIWSQAERSGSRARLLAVLDGARYLALLTALDALTADPPATADGAPVLRPAAARPARKVLRKAVRKDFARLTARLAAAWEAPPGDDRDRALHEARKSAKRVRYAAEAARPGLGDAAAGLAERITEVQRLLGEHQDSVLARATLRDLAVQAHAAGESTFTFGLLYGREEAAAAAVERALPGLWREVSGKEHRAAPEG